MHAEPKRVEENDIELLERLSTARAELMTQVRHRIVGQQEVLDGILTAIVSGGHGLLVGVPGEEDPGTGKRAFRFIHGPVFANVVLADEINRTPPKTQAALLQAMQEHEVTAAGETYHLPEPFFVLATQNPIEQEGTYPLPEAQLDRFMLELRVPYPNREEEERMVETTTGDETPRVDAVLTGGELIRTQHLVRRIPAPKSLVAAAVALARTTRPAEEDAPELVREYIDWGAGPRASQFLVLGAKARAALDGRPMADLDDVKAVALSVLRHRLVVNFAAEAAGRTAEDICAELIGGESWIA